MDLRTLTSTRPSTTGGGLRLTRHSILGLLLAAAAGCAEPAVMTRHEIPAARIVAPADDELLREEVRQELGDEAAEALPPVPRPRPQPVDPGAADLFARMIAGVDSLAADEDGETRIGLRRMRNLSHAQPREFEAFLDRCAELLTRAGRDHRIVVLSEDGHVHYHLHGSAYLITAEGIDQWELHLSLSPADASWTVWEPPGPVRVLRQARPGAQQVFVPMPVRR